MLVHFGTLMQKSPLFTYIHSVLYAEIDPNIDKCDQVFPRCEAPLNSGIMVIRPSQAAFQLLMNGPETLTGSSLTYLKAWRIFITIMLIYKTINLSSNFN